MPPDDFARRFEAADLAERRELLIARFRWDLEGFCRWCWPERFDLPFNSLHRALFDVALQRPGYNERTDVVRSAVAAPRGYAKSTISTFALVLHRILYGLEAYIVLLSVESSLARRFSRELRAALKSGQAPARANGKRSRKRAADQDHPLEALFGALTVEGGIDEWMVTVPGAPPVAVLAKSQGASIRGAKHPTRGVRPTLVILDDVEHKDRVRNPDQRALTWSWLHSDVLKLGRRQGGTDVWVRGTTLHPESMLAKLMPGTRSSVGWSAQRWRAIVSWPKRGDLWKRCGEIYCDLTLDQYGDGVRVRAAKAFYAANRAAMDDGVEVLDPDVEDIFKLHELIWVEGLASFLREKQNEPTDPSAAIFDVANFRRFRIVVDGKREVLVRPDGRRVAVNELRRYAFWDPSMGLPDGDYAAIAVVGRDQWGYCYVLDVWVARVKPSEQLAAAWRIAQRWGLSSIEYEANGFQELVTQTFGREQDERRERKEFWRLSLIPRVSTENKEQRIAGLEPDAVAGWLSFGDHLPPLVDQQFQQFPGADHDDVPDAIQRAWEASGGRPVAMSDEPLRRTG